MMLVQKQQHFPLTAPFQHHRRHPSAPPAVVVQPTRTPGLLSLSKPQRPSPQRQQHQPSPQRQPRPSPKIKTALATSAANRSSQPAPQPPALKPSAAIPEKQSLVPTDATHTSSEKTNGRGRKSAKDKTARRSASHSSLRGGRRNARQASPPQTSQAEDPSTPTNTSFAASNFFDPFLDDPVQDRGSNAKLPVRAAPTLSVRPTGKLANRRQSTAIVPATPTPAPSKAVPVPRPMITKHVSSLSRSDPAPSHMPTNARSSNKRWDAFPICDDLTDAGDDDDATPPSTPVRSNARRGPLTWKQGQYDDGPRTAPLSSVASGFPFGGFNTPSPSPASRPSRRAASPSPPVHIAEAGVRSRQHKRSPSEGIFNISSDESNGAPKSTDTLKALFGLVPPKRSGSAGSNHATPNGKDAAGMAGYFASSTFQNSPSPDELPPPNFV